MLSGPITQEAGITETRVREEEREQGRWRNGEEETVVRREEELEEIKMHEDKLGSNRAQNIISKVRLSLNIGS